MVKIIKRFNKWVEAISLLIMGLLIGEFTQVGLVLCAGAGVFWYRTRQEKRLREDAAEGK